MSEAQNRINVYTCPHGHKTVTINRDQGTTPFLIRCPDLTCDDMAQSCMYQCDQTLKPQFEWYRPSEAEQQSLEPEVLEHVQRGGLLKRRISHEDLELRYGFAGPRQG